MHGEGDGTRFWRGWLGRAAVCATLWAGALLMVDVCVYIVRNLGLGWDSHAYWSAWHQPMYSGAPDTPDAYLYSPAFAQAFWPLAHLPWAVACTATIAAPALGLAWMVRPLHWSWAVPLWLLALPETLSGNIFWLLALTALFGLRWPALWAVAALTKITPCLGPVWFAVRREWRSLAISVGTTAAIAAASWALAPGLWRDWIHFLDQHAGQTSHRLGATAIALPLLMRLPLAAAVVVGGAITDRRWALPVAMALATPVVSVVGLVVLYAIPRLIEAEGMGSPCTAPESVPPLAERENVQDGSGRPAATPPDVADDVVAWCPACPDRLTPHRSLGRPAPATSVVASARGWSE